jgi:uncharacterized membrane protein
MEGYMSYELIEKNANDTLSFGDFTLNEKKKVSDFEFDGAKYKVKTYNELTRLEKNEIFAYESEPGSRVENYKAIGDTIEFNVKAGEDVQITLGVEADSEYEVTVSGEKLGKMATNISGKLVLRIEMKNPDAGVDVKVVKC